MIKCILIISYAFLSWLRGDEPITDLRLQRRPQDKTRQDEDDGKNIVNSELPTGASSIFLSLSLQLQSVSRPLAGGHFCVFFRSVSGEVWNRGANVSQQIFGDQITRRSFSPRWVNSPDPASLYMDLPLLPLSLTSL